MKKSKLTALQKIGIAFLIPFLLLLVLQIMFFAFMMYIKVIGPALNDYPTDQPGSKWASEDGKISFKIEGVANVGYGTMLLEDGSLIDIQFYASSGTGKEIFISIPVDNGEAVKDIEIWRGDFKHKDRFTATVKKTTYFEVGQKITFYRVDEDIDTMTTKATANRLLYGIEDHTSVKGIAFDGQKYVLIP